jgi:signal transduction histidine kinase
MSIIRQVSITHKLTRMNMFVSATALLLTCTGFVAYDLATYRQALLHNLSIESQVTGLHSVSALLFDDPQSAERTLSALEAAPNIVAACIYAPDGKQFATYRRDQRALIPASPRISIDQGENYWFEGGNVMLVHTITFQNRLVGFTYIQSDLQRIVARLRSYLAIAGSMLVLSLLLALFLSRFARRSIAQPIVNLAEIAHRVSRDKDYSIRVVPGREEGELADLVKTFNEMLGQIEERDRSLERARGELELRVQQRTAELAAANKELEAFSYSVSHDLRAPLRSIDGFSAALLEDCSDRLDSEGRDYLSRIRSATLRMAALIDDLLSLSRVARAELRREPIRLSEVALAIGEELRKSDPGRQVEFLVQDGMNAFGDSRLLRVVLENLLSNAWKYTSKHPTARIEFGRQQLDGKDVYFVRDDGAGFDPAYAGRLFGAFQRLHGMDEFPGTGVGLATVQRIIHRHGGRVWAEGAVEKGATFYFML